jgi:hypothetical protein
VSAASSGVDGARSCTETGSPAEDRRHCRVEGAAPRPSEVSEEFSEEGNLEEVHRPEGGGSRVRGDPLMGKTSVELSFMWKVLGAVTLTSTEKLAFPEIPGEPGIYRLRVVSDTTETYIGESSHLYRRFEHDYKYMPRGSTNVWVRAWLTGHIAEARVAEISVMTEARATIDGAADHLIARPSR